MNLTSTRHTEYVFPRIRQCVIRGNDLQLERTDCLIRGNELQSERTSCPIRGNELLIRGNELLIRSLQGFRTIHMYLPIYVFSWYIYMFSWYFWIIAQRGTRMASYFLERKVLPTMDQSFPVGHVRSVIGFCEVHGFLIVCFRYFLIKYKNLMKSKTTILIFFVRLHSNIILKWFSWKMADV